MSIIVWDNDECSGQYGAFSLFYNIYKLKNWDNEFPEKILVDIMQTYLKDYGARPGLKKTFKDIDKMKKNGSVKGVVMYTNAEDNPPGYVNFVKKCLEKYTNTSNFFDLVLSRKHSSGKVVPPVRKKLEIVVDYLKKMNIDCKVEDVMMVDDKPSTIYEHCKLKLQDNNFKDKNKHVKVYKKDGEVSEILIGVPDYNRSVSEKTMTDIIEQLQKYTNKITPAQIKGLMDSYKKYDKPNMDNCERESKDGYVLEEVLSTIKKHVKPKKVEQEKPKPKKVEQEKPKPKKVEQAKPKPKKVEQAKPKPKKVVKPKSKPKKVEQAKPKPKKVEKPKPKPKKVVQAKPIMTMNRPLRRKELFCKKGYVRNPQTNRCIKIGGPTYNKLLKKESIISRKKGNCIERSKIKLRKLQKKVVRIIMKEDIKGLLVAHDTGIGKTLTAVTASQCYLDSNKRGKIVFVGPASLVANFEKELDKYGVKNKDKYSAYSYRKFMMMKKRDEMIDCHNTMVIIDEVHNLRNFEKYDKILKKRVLTPTFAAVFDCIKYSDKLLLLTATPYVNSLGDFNSLINLMSRDIRLKSPKYGGVDYISKQFNKNNVNKVVKYLDKKIDFASKNMDENFPSKRNFELILPMSKKYFDKYKKALLNELGDLNPFDNPAPFYNGHRRAVNSLGDEHYTSKIKVITKLVKKSPKSIVYTNWLKFGIDPLKASFVKNGIKFREFCGKVSKKDRAKIVKDFNEDKFDVIIMSKCGGEGLDFKGVRDVIITDPPWNDANLKQIVGRAIRYQSHNHLPKRKRVVTVWEIVSVAPGITKDNWLTDDSISGDVILYKIIRRKEKEGKEVRKLLKGISL